MESRAGGGMESNRRTNDLIAGLQPNGEKGRMKSTGAGIEENRTGLVKALAQCVLAFANDTVASLRSQ